MKEYKLSDDKTFVTLMVSGEEKTFSTTEVEELITLFGYIRHQMSPPVPFNFTEATLYRPLSNVTLNHATTEQNPFAQGAVLKVMSSQFGWFDYELSAELCQGMAQWLAGNAAAINPPVGSTLN